MKITKEKETLRIFGIALTGGLVILFWWLGWFSLFFYILGLYAAVYIVSYLFKTKAIINFMLGIGGFTLYAVSMLVGLYLLYLILHLMFTGSFFIGLILLIVLGIFNAVISLIPMAIGLILGYPLIFMSEDIEKRFYLKNEDTEMMS